MKHNFLLNCHSKSLITVITSYNNVLKYQNFVFLKKKESRWQTRKNFSDERDISRRLDFFMASTAWNLFITQAFNRKLTWLSVGIDYDRMGSTFLKCTFLILLSIHFSFVGIRAKNHCGGVIFEHRFRL